MINLQLVSELRTLYSLGKSNTGSGSSFPCNVCYVRLHQQLALPQFFGFIVFACHLFVLLLCWLMNSTLPCQSLIVIHSTQRLRLYFSVFAQLNTYAYKNFCFCIAHCLLATLNISLLSFKLKKSFWFHLTWLKYELRWWIAGGRVMDGSIVYFPFLNLTVVCI